ncbi:MAG TPA: RDD family protein [Jatrophihabitantaceae bacterium]|nr:RDD family protein [Jatrophihabitantaceae bacterium]
MSNPSDPNQPDPTPSEQGWDPQHGFHPAPPPPEAQPAPPQMPPPPAAAPPLPGGHPSPGGQYFPPPPGQPYGPPPGQPFQAAPRPPMGYGYGEAGVVPAGMYFDPASGLTLPQGTALASVGRRIGAYFLAIPLFIVTLGIGYIIWGLVLWGRGTSPALSVLGMRVWRPAENRPATWGVMALRDIIGRIVDGILSFITGLISFILFVSTKEHRALHDMVAGTVVLHDPNKVIPK